MKENIFERFFDWLTRGVNPIIFTVIITGLVVSITEKLGFEWDLNSAGLIPLGSLVLFFVIWFISALIKFKKDRAYFNPKEKKEEHKKTLYKSEKPIERTEEDEKFDKAIKSIFNLEKTVIEEINKIERNA